MAHLVISDVITLGNNMAIGQVLQLGGFAVCARVASGPAALPTVIEHHPYVDSGHSDDATSADLSPLNELLDCIATLGLSSPGDQIGPKSG